jgi:uncharacterized membrane protein
MVLLTVLAGLLVRHGFNRADMRVDLSVSPLLLEWATYAVVWLVMALLAVGAGRRYPAAMLGTYARVLATLAMVAVVAGPLLTASPLWTRQAVGAMPVLNWLLYVYGLPALLLLGIGWGWSRRENQAFARSYFIAGLVLLTILTGLLVRQGFNRSDMRLDLDVPPALLEWATYVAVWLVMALAAVGAAARRSLSMLAYYGLVLAGLGAAAVIAGPLLTANPLWSHQLVGPMPVLNWLLYAYGVPALLLALLAWKRPPVGRELAGWLLGVSALVLLFVLVNLEVRQAFHRQDMILIYEESTGLTYATIAQAERYSYSCAWVVFALAALAGGVWRKSLLLRWASLAVMLLAIGRAFVDAARLQDLYRVLSLLGLGLALLALGYVYHRFVFARGSGSDVAAPGAGPLTPEDRGDPADPVPHDARSPGTR